MKKLLLLSGLLLIFLVFCQKKIFRVVRGHGRILNYITYEPINTEIHLMGQDATTAKDVPLVTLKTTHSGDDGIFSFKSHASRRNSYCLSFAESDFKYCVNAKLKDGADVDLGDILIGKFTFSCQVSLNSISSSSITIYGDPGTSFNFGPTSTQFLHTLTFTKEDFDFWGGYYRIPYTIKSSSQTTHSVVALQTNGSAILTTTISY